MTAKPTCPNCGAEIGGVFARMGGQARSDAKNAANKKRADDYWAAVKAGLKPAPNHRRNADVEAAK